MKKYLLEIFEKFKEKASIPRYKSFAFWAGIISIVLLALGVDPTTLTSWGAIGDVIVDTVTNPYKIGLVVLAVYGNWNNPTQKGLN